MNIAQSSNAANNCTWQTGTVDGSVVASFEVRENTLVHSRGFSFDVRVHDLDPTLRHSVLVTSNVAKQKLKLFTKFQARRQSKWQLASRQAPAAVPKLPVFMVTVNDSRWRGDRHFFLCIHNNKKTFT